MSKRDNYKHNMAGSKFVKRNIKRSSKTFKLPGDRIKFNNRKNVNVDLLKNSVLSEYGYLESNQQLKQKIIIEMYTESPYLTSESWTKSVSGKRLLPL